MEGSGGQSLKTAVMIRADAGKVLVADPSFQGQMTGLRVQHAMEQPAVAHNAGPDTGADGNVNAVFQPSGTTKGSLSQQRAVDVCVKADGYSQFPAKETCHIAPGPAGLGRSGNISIGGGIPMQIHRTKTGYSQSLNPLVPKKIRKPGQGFLRRCGGNRHLLQDIPLLSLCLYYGADHLGPAGLQCILLA